MHLFVTGTDTGVGKTRVTCQWVRRWRARGVQAVGLKPISTGDRDDALQLHEAAEAELTLDEVNPCVLPLPLAPWVAARQTGIGVDSLIDFDRVAASVAEARRRFSHVAVEGIGGWLTPLAKGRTVREWAVELGLPVLVVAHAGLGTLNHVLLTVESIEKAGLPLLGIVLNHHREGDTPSLAAETNREALAAWTGVPVLEVPLGGELPATGVDWLPSL